MSGMICNDCCRANGGSWVLPQQGRDFIQAGCCGHKTAKKSFPVKSGSEIHQYELLAYVDGPDGVCVEAASADTDPATYAGFALHCFFTTDTGGVTFLAGGGFASDMAVVPDGFVWDAATISNFATKGFCPEVVCGVEGGAA